MYHKGPLRSARKETSMGYSLHCQGKTGLKLQKSEFLLHTLCSSSSVSSLTFPKSSISCTLCAGLTLINFNQFVYLLSPFYSSWSLLAPVLPSIALQQSVSVLACILTTKTTKISFSFTISPVIKSGKATAKVSKTALESDKSSLIPVCETVTLHLLILLGWTEQFPWLWCLLFPERKKQY